VRETEKIRSQYTRKLAPLGPIISREGENLMICRRTESNDILLELVAKTLAIGAYEMQVEYEDRKEHVLAFQEGFGFGIASLDASSEEAQALRDAVSDQAKAKDCHHREG
jgi:hypothetical protein